LHPNLFHEFQPMGGVSARFAEGDAACCAARPLPQSTVQNNIAKGTRLDFMQTFYQKPPEIGMKR
jgi:hypothetical protein